MKIQVKVALVVNANGSWAVCGWKDANDRDMLNMAFDSMDGDGSQEGKYWLTVEVDAPSNVPLEIAGKAEAA